MANDLQTIESKSIIPSCELALPEGLSAIFDRVTSVRDLPACGAKGRAWLDAAIAEHQAGIAGAPRGAIEDLLSGLSVAFPNARTSDAEASARLEAYSAALSDIPADILKAALQKAVKVCKFFPSVAEIREFSAGPQAVRAWRLMAMQWMAREYDRKQPIDDPITDEQRAQLPALLKSAA